MASELSGVEENVFRDASMEDTRKVQFGMKTHVMSSDEVRNKWRGVMDEVMMGGTVTVRRYDKNIAAVIPYEAFEAVQEALQDYYDAALADEIYAAYKQDPSTAVPLEEAMSRWFPQGRDKHGEKEG